MADLPFWGGRLESTAPFDRGLFYSLTTVGSTLLALVLIGAVADATSGWFVTRALGVAGRTTLTLYVGHVLVFNLLVVFAGGSYFQWFPLRGLTSDNWDQLSWPAKIVDYLWHIALPVLASTISSFATLTLLTKNSFLDEIKKQYVMTARAKGLSESAVLYGHVFRNAMLIVIAGFPAVFVSVFFGGSLIIETIFSLDGLGRLGFEAAVARDYPVVFGTLFVFGLMGLVVGILSDLMYVWIDPRIDFERRG